MLVLADGRQLYIDTAGIPRAHALGVCTNTDVVRRTWFHQGALALADGRQLTIDADGSVIVALPGAGVLWSEVRLSLRFPRPPARGSPLIRQWKGWFPYMKLCSVLFPLSDRVYIPTALWPGSGRRRVPNDVPPSEVDGVFALDCGRQLHVTSDGRISAQLPGSASNVVERRRTWTIVRVDGASAACAAPATTGPPPPKILARGWTLYLFPSTIGHIIESGRGIRPRILNIPLGRCPHVRPRVPHVRPVWFPACILTCSGVWRVAVNGARGIADAAGAWIFCVIPWVPLRTGP